MKDLKMSKSTWHYQLMKHKDGSLAVHEYYHMINGASWTADPISISGDDVDDIKKSMKRILKDIDKHGVKNYE